MTNIYQWTDKNVTCKMLPVFCREEMCIIRVATSPYSIVSLSERCCRQACVHASWINLGSHGDAQALNTQELSDSATVS